MAKISETVGPVQINRINEERAFILRVSPPPNVSLQEALEKFPDAIKEGIDRMVEDAKELQRQESSRIVVPGAGTSGLGPGGGNIILGS